MAKSVALVVFDMAGTTIQDHSEVESCFYRAATESQLPASQQRIKDLQGLPKQVVVQILWAEAIGSEHPDYDQRVVATYQLFQIILEQHYQEQAIRPVEGALECFQWLKSQGVYIALTTGFYRKVANIILARLGWNPEQAGSPIDLSLTPDETGRGRPHPDMIQYAMRHFRLSDPQQVVKVGDTPADLQAGHAAQVGWNVAVTSGTHRAAALITHPHTAIIESVKDLPAVLGSERSN